MVSSKPISSLDEKNLLESIAPVANSLLDISMPNFLTREVNEALSDSFITPKATFEWLIFSTKVP